MAINKVVNKSTKSHGAMRNVLEYVLRDEKIKEGYAYIAFTDRGERLTEKLAEAMKKLHAIK